jgi:hypothetical protein
MEIAHKMLISKNILDSMLLTANIVPLLKSKQNNTNSLENKMRFYPKLDKTSFKESLLKYYPFIFSFCRV